MTDEQNDRLAEAIYRAVVEERDTMHAQQVADLTKERDALRELVRSAFDEAFSLPREVQDGWGMRDLTASEAWLDSKAKAVLERQ